MLDWKSVVVSTCVALLLAVPASAADKLDVIQLRNGDRLTCEIKKLDQSVLTASTDPLDKVSVHWGEIVGVTSPRTFDVQLASGEHYYGSLVAAPAGSLAIAAASGSTTTVAMSEVIRLAPIG